jgi:hypothetical protein
MPRRRWHTPDQIIRKLAGKMLLAGGAELDAVCRHLEIAESTWHRWLAQYGSAELSASRLTVGACRSDGLYKSAHGSYCGCLTALLDSGVPIAPAFVSVWVPAASVPGV